MKDLSAFVKKNDKNNITKEDSNTLCNNILLSDYSSLTPKQSLKDLEPYNKKNYPLKKDVCMGNINYSQNFTIPTSSAIIQYFNLDNILNNDHEFQCENKKIGKTYFNKIDNIRKREKNTYSSPNLFNNKFNHDLRKKKIIRIQDKNENNHINKRNGVALLTFSSKNNNIIDENYNTLHKRNNIKKNNLIDKNKTNNRKKSKNLSITFHNYYIIDNKKDKSQSINYTKEKQNKKSLNALNIITDDNSITGNNKSKDSIKDKKILFSFPNETSKNFDLYIEVDNTNSKQSIMKNKDEKKEDINTNEAKKNNIIIKNKNKNVNYNNKLRINNNDNYIYNNDENLQYIHNMEFNCNNLNIYNNSNIEINSENRNMEYQNAQKIYYSNIYNDGKNIFENILLNNNINNIYNKNINNINKYKNKISLNYITKKEKVAKNIGLNNNYNKKIINSNKSLVNNAYNCRQGNEKKKKRCKILDVSFYLNKPLNFLGDNLLKLGKDQGACRYLQNLLDIDPQETLKYLYKSLCENILPLINYPFGNYFIQKIIIHLDQEQLYEILNIISDYFLDICNNIYGTRVIQTIIDNLKTQKVTNYFYQLLKPNIIDLLKVLNGTFVVQKFSKIHKNYTNEINDIVINDSLVLSTHRHGSCVIQKYLGLNDSNFVQKLVDKLLEKSLLLIIDQYGNYVLQAILDKNNINYGNTLAEKIVENFVYYAKHKYSSNVVRKCFDNCDGIYLSNLINKVQKKENLIELLLDEHGNYVVQKVLNIANPTIRNQMLKIIKINLNKLKNCYHGKRLINRLIYNYPIFNEKIEKNEYYKK